MTLVNNTFKFLVFFACVLIATAFAACNNEPVTTSPSPESADVSSSPEDGAGGASSAQAAAAVCSPDAVSAAITVSPIGQTAAKWCWLASEQMVLASLNPPIEVCQCREARRILFNTEDGECCNSKLSTTDPCKDVLDPVLEACNRTGWPDFKFFGINPGITDNRPLSFDALKYQLGCLHAPVAFSWHTNGGGGHMMVASGYQVDADGTQFIYCNDPEQALWMITYAEYKDDNVPGYPEYDHTHWNDYYNLFK